MTPPAVQEEEEEERIDEPGVKAVGVDIENSVSFE